jgi:D-3-phosphoglycerate dehydrogenase
MKKLIIDFDSTLVKIETLDVLARRALLDRVDGAKITAEIEKITELGMNGEISFPDSLQRRIALIQTTQDLVLEMADFIKDKLSDSVFRNIDFFRNNAENIIIISGGFKDLIFPTADFLGIARENVLANEFLFENGILIGVDSDNLMAQENGKVNQIKKLDLRGELIMVGDGWTDYQTREFKVVDKFIAYTENIYREKVVRVADLVADDFDKIIKIFYNK